MQNKFAVGGEYYSRSIVNNDLIVYYTIKKRTPKQVVFLEHSHNSKPKAAKVFNSKAGVEFFYPDGRYSMARSVYADDPKEGLKGSRDKNVVHLGKGSIEPLKNPIKSRLQTKSSNNTQKSFSLRSESTKSKSYQPDLFSFTPKVETKPVIKADIGRDDLGRIVVCFPLSEYNKIPHEPRQEFYLYFIFSNRTKCWLSKTRNPKDFHYDLLRKIGLEFEVNELSIKDISQKTPKQQTKPKRKNTAVRKATGKKINSQKLREKADSLSKKIEQKKNPPISQQNPTARRARIAANMYYEGEQLEKVQAILNKLADLNDKGEVPDFVPKNISISSVLDEIGKRFFYEEHKHNISYSYLEKPEQTELQNFLWNLTEYNPELHQEKEIKEIERSLIGSKIAGFFPTPKPIIDKLIELADIYPSDRVLEPSAGKGDIAEEAKTKSVTLDVIEIDSDLRKLLKLKGFNVLDERNFLRYSTDHLYDKVVMNPPFEKKQDQEHVRHAFDLLKPGGRLVAIMSEGTFFRSDKQTDKFREFLYENDADIIDLPAGAFKGKDSFRQTGVKTRIVVINK
ncbi:MAG: hypothetical protein AAF518_20485 [Spirochaetota bacterium]